jgi:hypothetical protein
MKIEIDGNISVNVSGVMIKVDADAVLALTGGITKIN